MQRRFAKWLLWARSRRVQFRQHSRPTYLRLRFPLLLTSDGGGCGPGWSRGRRLTPLRSSRRRPVVQPIHAECIVEIGEFEGEKRPAGWQPPDWGFVSVCDENCELTPWSLKGRQLKFRTCFRAYPGDDSPFESSFGSISSAGQAVNLV